VAIPPGLLALPQRVPARDSPNPSQFGDGPESEVVRLLQALLVQQREDQAVDEPIGLLVAPLGAVLRRQASQKTQVYLDTQEGRLMSILKRNSHVFTVLDPKKNGGHVVSLAPGL
jgi:hypothetical protein